MFVPNFWIIFYYLFYIGLIIRSTRESKWFSLKSLFAWIRPVFECLYQVWSPLGNDLFPEGWEFTSKIWDAENSWKMLNEPYSRNNLILEKSIKQQFVKNAHLHVKVSRFYHKERFIEPKDSLNDSYQMTQIEKGFNGTSPSCIGLDLTVCINLINIVWYLNTIYVTFPRNSYGFW